MFSCRDACVRLADEAAARADKPQRCDQKHIVHENPTAVWMETNFGRCSDISVRTSFEDWMNAFCNRKYDSDFAKEMTRSVGEY